jgi:hypothetical protein
MKKIISTSVLFFSLFLIFAFDKIPVAHAQGTFTCRMKGYGPNVCIVVEYHCDSGYEADSNTCSAITDSDKCRNSPPYPCVPSGTAVHPVGTPECDTNFWCDCPNQTKLKTAIGCITILSPNGQNAFLADILRWAVGVGSGIAFLLIVYAGFMIMTATGNPERLKAGQELLTSAVAGLILLVFSVFILKFIGVDILGLCKFGFGTCT